MTNFFDEEKLKALLRDVYLAVDIRISVFDDNFNPVAEYPDHPLRLCSLIRKTKRGRDACRACDIAACKRAKEKLSAHIYTCHAGLLEAITPIQVHGKILGYAIFAHMLPKENLEESVKNIRVLCKKYIPDEKTLDNAIAKIQTHSREKILAAAHLLDTVTAYMYIAGLAQWKSDSLSDRLSAYIEDNLAGDLSCETLCAVFYVSRTKLFQTAKRTFGMSIHRYIQKVRADKAQYLLLNTDMTIADVAAAVGASDYNYFCKCFKKATGLSPRKFKENRQS